MTMFQLVIFFPARRQTVRLLLANCAVSAAWDDFPFGKYNDTQSGASCPARAASRV